MKNLGLLIVGGGPAGLSTAMHLLQQGGSWAERMLIIEKAAHPRQKLCGGGLTRLGLLTLANLGLQIPPPIPHAWDEEVRFVYKGRTIHVRGHPQLLIFLRAKLDAYLADQARQRGVVICQNETVKTLVFDHQGVTVNIDQDVYRAQTVIGADGSKGLTHRLIAGERSKRHMARSLEVLSPAGLGEAVFCEHYAVLDVNPVQEEMKGNFWIFPTFLNGDPHYNRGVYDARMDDSRPRARLPGILKACIETQSEDARNLPIEGHPIRWFNPRSHFSRPRLLLVCDAAGVDPLFGEGIAPSLAYGKIAAETFQEAFTRNDFSSSDYRRRILISPLGRYLLVRWSIVWWSYRFSGKPWFMHTLWTLGDFVNHLWPEPRLLRGNQLPITRQQQSCTDDLHCKEGTCLNPKSC